MRATWHDFGVTVVAWHRAGFRLFRTQKVRRGQPGRPVPPILLIYRVPKL
jgi:hypothetical protein